MKALVTKSSQDRPLNTTTDKHRQTNTDRRTQTDGQTGRQADREPERHRGIGDNGSWWQSAWIDQMRRGWWVNVSDPGGIKAEHQNNNRGTRTNGRRLNELDARQQIKECVEDDSWDPTYQQKHTVSTDIWKRVEHKQRPKEKIHPVHLDLRPMA